MGWLIKEDGQVLEVKPANGKDFSLAELQEYVKGPIEVVCIQNAEGENEKPVICNEEGKLIGMEPNIEATRRWLGDDRKKWHDVLYGPVVVCEYSELE